MFYVPFLFFNLVRKLSSNLMDPRKGVYGYLLHDGYVKNENVLDFIGYIKNEYNFRELHRWCICVVNMYAGSRKPSGHWILLRYYTGGKV